MTPIKKAHDKFIRDLMSRKPVVQDFLRYYLDQELVNLLDLSTLEIKKDTFVDQELVERGHACPLPFFRYPLPAKIS